MTFRAQINQELRIDGVSYYIAEHPHAPGMPYGQEGRQAIVYQLVANQKRKALKVFKPRYRLPGLVALTNQLGPFAEVPGLQVCKRTVLTPRRHPDLLRQHPDLTYSVLMPWIDGPTWLELLLDDRKLTPEQCLNLARSLSEILADMEEHRIAHCDLSGSNMLLPGLATDLASRAHPLIELVDVEQIYGPNIDRPDLLPGGSSGYAHPSTSGGVWTPVADRFSGAVLLAEILGWSDERVRSAAWGESYFDPGEMQQNGKRYQFLLGIVRNRWGDQLARLLERVWRSETLPDCPTFGEWLVALPDRPIERPAMISPLELAAETTPPSHDVSTAVEKTVIGSTQIANRELDQLFENGLAAYEDGDWSRATELLGEVVRRRPDYQQDKKRAMKLWQEADRHLRSPAAPRRGSKAWGVSAALVLVLLMFGGIALLQAQSTATVHAYATATAQTLTQQKTSAAISVAYQQATVTVAAIATEGAWQTSTSVAIVIMTTEAEKSAQSRTTSTAVAVQATEQAISTGTVGAHVQQTSTAVAQSRQATQTVEAQAIGTVQSVSVQQTAEALRLGPLHKLSDPGASLIIAFSPDGQFLASGGYEAQVRIWNSGNGLPASEIVTTRGAVNSLAFSPDGELIAIAETCACRGPGPEEVDRVALWRVADGAFVRTLTKPKDDDSVWSVAFSSDGLIFASAFGSGKIIMWDTSTWSILRLIDAHKDWVTELVFSPSGKILASTSQDGSVKLWRVSDGALLHTMDPRVPAVFAMAFSPDGSLLVTGAGVGRVVDEPGVIQVWRVGDGALMKRFEAHNSAVTTLAFSPDGSYFATGGQRDAVNLWRASDYSLIRTLEKPPDNLNTMAFSPDGALLGLGASEVWIWKVP